MQTTKIISDEQNRDSLALQAPDTPYKLSAAGLENWTHRGSELLQRFPHFIQSGERLNIPRLFLPKADT